MCGLRGTADQFHVGDRGDGRQRFAPKAHRGHPFKFQQVADLARGMALERQWQFARWDTQTIVFDHDSPNTTAAQAQHDVACTGVQCVVQEFPNHRSRPLHHLAGGNLTDEFIRQFDNRPARPRLSGGRG